MKEGRYMKYLYDGNLNDEVNRRQEGDIEYYIRGCVEVEGRTYERYAIHTHFIEVGEDYMDLMRKYIVPFIQPGDILSTSEKVIAMCQNAVVRKSEMKLKWYTKFMSKFGKKTDQGIGITEPYKLQLMIDMKGLPLVLWAGFRGLLGKLVGKRGIFYEILGPECSGIDGFYDHSDFEIYHDMATLIPREPSKVCNEMKQAFGFSAMIVDANDLNVEVLGKSDDLKAIDDKNLALMIDDNPAGQGDECTPFIIIRDITGKEPMPFTPKKERAQ